MMNPIEALPLETVQQIDELCDRFEEGWSADHQFQIEQFLREVSPEVQPALLAALLPIELELLEKEGQQPDIDSYRSRFPKFAEAIAAVVADTEQEDEAKSYQSGAAETFISGTGTDERPADQAEVSTPTVMRGNVDSQTSIKPVETGQESASIIEGEFGRYTIQKTLGQGAMGAVYLAHDTQLDRQVALKIPKFTDDPNGEMLERFYREARSAAMLRSPNICPVFDVGEIEGQHYITMAFIPGRTLKDFTKSKKRHSEKQIAVTIRKLAVGLGEAHAHGVIHRDLKPANIMIDGKGEPVVMDFGLARRNASSEVEVTQTGAILGTPAYMSPEQVEGEQSEIGPQSDIYSLGVIMYELVTGQMPFQGTLMKILKQIAVDEPRPPSELRDELDSTIETICLKMMAKDQSTRYQSMEEVARDLAAYLKKPRKKKAATEDIVQPAIEESAGDSIAVGEESNPVLKTAPPKAKQLAKSAAAKKPGKSSNPPQTRSLGQIDIARYRKIAIAVAAVAACGLLYGAITLFLRVGEVDVKVVIDDPSISVHFEEGGVVRFEGSGKPIKLKPGKQKFVIESDGLTAKAAEFTVSKDGKTVLHVAIINGKLAVVGDGVKPQKIAQQVASKNSDRDIATWVIKAGGRVTMNAGKVEELLSKSHFSWIDSLEELPTGSIRLEGLYIPIVDQETIGRLPELAQVKSLKALTLDLSEWKGKSIDTELAEIKELKSLEYLHVATTPRYPGSGRRRPRLNGACLKTVAQLPALTVLHLQFVAVTDSDLEFIKDMRSLRTVRLSEAEISDAGLAHLSKLQQLEFLSLYGSTRIGDEGLNFVGELSALQMLQLSKTQVTDKGLSSLHSLKNLHELWLGQTKVTSAGVAALKAALPNCEVRDRAGANSPPPAIAPFDIAQAKAHQQAWADYLGVPVEKEVVLPGGEKMQFMLIPPGEFMMGSSEKERARFVDETSAAGVEWAKWAINNIAAEGPQHTVRITKPFYLGRYEVTQAQWTAVTGREPVHFKNNPTLPITTVGWTEVAQFMAKLNKSPHPDAHEFGLPTEAQWEYACRAGTTTPWHFGDSDTNVRQYSWHSSRNESGPKPVGERKPNAFSLYDLYGNNWEWCADWHAADYYAKSPIDDPRGPARGTERVARGGGSDSGHSILCRSAYRMSLPPTSRPNHTGFRVAMTIDMAKLKQAQTPPANPDRERKAAEWVLSLEYGSNEVITNRGTLKSRKQLPKEDFFITGIHLSNHIDHISDEGLAKLNGLSRIERLHIHATHVGDVACQHIAKLTTLKYLAFVQTNLSDEGLVHLKQMPHLEHLSLPSGNKKITDAGLQHLAGMTNLKSLDISGTNANDAGLVHLVGLQNLERLSINKTRVSDDGLLQFEKLVRLQDLELRETRVTDDGLVHLKGLKKLTYIDLRDTKVTAAGVADLKKALPSCRIQHGTIASAPRPSPFDHLTRQDAPPTDPPLGDDIPLVAVLAGDDLRLKHWNMITQIAISADGKHLVTASADQTIKVWDAETGKLKRTLSSREHAPGRIAISPDGKTLASVGQGDDRLWLWDIESGELRRSKSIVQNINLGRSWMPDGRQIVMIGDPVQGKELVFVNTETLEVVARLKYQAKKAWMPVVSPDGNWLALASQIGEGANRKTVAQLWNLSKKEFVGTVPMNGSLEFTKDSRQLYAGTKAFDVKTRAEVLDFSTDPPSRPLRFSPDLKLYLQRRGNGFIISGVDKSRALVQLGVPSDPYRNHAAFFPDGKRVVTASQGLFGGNSVRIWSTDTGQELMTERGDVLSHLYGGLVFSSDGQTLFRTENSRVIKRDLNTGRDDGSFDPKDSFNAMRSVDVTEDGNYLAVYANYGKVWLWNLSNGSETRVSHSAGNHIGVARLAFNRAGSLLAIPGDSGASLCDLPSGEEIQTFVMPEDVPKKDVTSVAFSPDGKRLAMGGVNNVIFRDIDKSSETSRLQMEWKNPQHVLGMSFSPDGALIAIGSREFVEIWDVKQRHRVAELPSEANCRSVSFSPDGSMVAWGCDDGMVRLWDVAAGKLLAEYQIGPPRGIIKQVAFTPDSRYLATANGNGSVYVLRLPAAKANDVKVPPPAKAPFNEAQAKAHQKAWADYLGKPVVTTNSIGMKFVVIPPGKFKMGEDDTAVDVTLTKPFQLGIHEVTQRQWKRVMESEPWKESKLLHEGENVAATNLTWNDVAQFCLKLTERERTAGRLPRDWGYRLPTEAEWEYACRAGTTTKYSFGDDDSQLGWYAWYYQNAMIVGENHAHVVGQKRPNSWGLYDMHGNVWELCADWYDDKLSGGVDPLGAGAGYVRVCRGSSWGGNPDYQGSARRYKAFPANRNEGHGFRVVLSPVESERLTAP